MAWPGAGGWLRVALLAALAAALAASAFDFAVSEGLVDRAVRLESATGGHAHAAADAAGKALAVPEPFGRKTQRGGLVVAELVYGAGVAFLLAGAAAVLGPGTRRPRRPRRFLLTTIGAFTFASLVLPAVTYPPLPPGAETLRGISERQLLYLGLLALGVAGAAGAAFSLGRPLLRRPERLALATAVLAGTVAVALFGFPGDPLAAPYPDPALLDRFRAAAIGSQALFWAVLAAAAWWLMRPRPAAR
jgi:predicted cobalt transporter CbtA